MVRKTQQFDCQRLLKRGTSKACESPQTHDGGQPWTSAANDRAMARNHQCNICTTVGLDFPGQKEYFIRAMKHVDDSKDDPSLVPPGGLANQAAQQYVKITNEFKKFNEGLSQLTHDEKKAFLEKAMSGGRHKTRSPKRKTRSPKRRSAKHRKSSRKSHMRY